MLSLRRRTELKAGRATAGADGEVVLNPQAKAELAGSPALDQLPALLSLYDAPVVCAGCGAESRASAKFCAECGIAMGRSCPTCGAGVRAEQKFCEECGTALTPLAGPLMTSASASVEPTTVSVPLAERRVCSVLFADLVGFTPLSESRDPEEVRELLSAYFDTARTVITRYGGVVEKFIGDAVMAVWGVPAAHEDDAERAVRAGLDLVAAVATLGESVHAAGLALRVGLVTGEVAVTIGAVGEGMVAGDAVNTAARVQAVAEAGTVWVDAATRGLTRAAIGYADAGAHPLKGKAEAVPLFRAVRVVAAGGGAQRVEGLEASFLGRDRELRLVKEFFHDSADAAVARLLAISGPAGVGKSRLAWEFFKYVDGLAATVLWHVGRCLSYGEGVAFWALAAMVRQRADIAEEEPSAAVQAKLVATLERWIVDPAEREFLAPRLGALLGVAEPGLSREELFAGWRLFFVRLAEQSPVVLVVEDAGHADPGLLDFCDHLLDWAADAPIFIVTLARPELAERRAGWGATRRSASTLHLDPLPPAMMAALLDELVVGLPAAVRDRIVARADGVPLYAVETIRSLIDRDLVVPAGGVYRLVGEVGELAPPASLAALVAARIDALPEAERTLVRDLAVLGGTFQRPAVAAVCALPAAQADALLAALVRKEVLSIRADRLSPDRGQYAFTQGLLRTVAYDTLGRRDRKARHLAVAAHLRASFPDDGEDIAEVIAAHYADAYRAGPDDPDAEDVRAEAVAAYRRAGAQALTVGAPETALAAYRCAAELAADEAARAELTGLAGQAAEQAGQAAEALDLLDAAITAHTAAGRSRDAARLVPAAGRALADLGRHEEAIPRLEQALAGIDTGQPDLDTAALAAQLAGQLVFAGHVERAWPHLETALLHAQALELPGVLAHALNHRAIALKGAGRHDEALFSFEAAAAVADQHGLTREADGAHGNAGDLRMSGDLPGAADHARLALDLSRRRGDRFSEAIDTANLMLVHIFAGRWDEAEGLGMEGLADPGRPGAAFLHHRLALLAALRGDRDAAAHHVELLSAAWEDTDEVQLQAMLRATRGSVALAAGDSATALAQSSQAVAVGTSAFGLRGEAVRQGWPDAVEAAISLGRDEAAQWLLETVAALPRGNVPPYLRAQYARFRARLDAVRGQHDDAEAGFTTAEDILADLGYPYWLACTRLDHATWLAEQRQTERAAGLTEQAIRTLTELRAAPALAKARHLASSSATTPSPASPPSGLDP